MSQAMEDAKKRKELLKHMFIQLHLGQAPDEAKKRLVQLLGEVPYEEVVQVEQELLAEGIQAEEIVKMCDVHMEALKGAISHKAAPTALAANHPVSVFRRENGALRVEAAALRRLLGGLLEKDRGGRTLGEVLREVHEHYQRLATVEKHYLRKENLLFPFLERHGISGPSTVMWGKHDETRKQLNAAMEILKLWETWTAEEAASVRDMVLLPAVTAVEEMIVKEEEILFPMCQDNLKPEEWLQVHRQGPDIGFSLIEMPGDWQPEIREPVPEKKAAPKEEAAEEKIQLPSGSFTQKELIALLNTLPVDVTFVGADDRVRYFTEGKERIFTRSRAVIGREVRHCHPPKSLPVVERIIQDFKSGRQNSAAFWIKLNERFIHIEYFALRDETGQYLGTIEVSQDISEKKKIKGERRLLTYGGEKKK